MAATDVVRENIKEEGTLDYVNNKDDLCLFSSSSTLCISVFFMSKDGLK